MTLLRRMVGFRENKLSCVSECEYVGGEDGVRGEESPFISMQLKRCSEVSYITLSHGILPHALQAVISHNTEIFVKHSFPEQQTLGPSQNQYLNWKLSSKSPSLR